MMTTTKNQKLIGVLFRAMNRKKFCLVFLFCHLSFFIFANTPNPEIATSASDTLSTGQIYIIGKITVHEGATIVDTEKHPVPNSQKKIPAKEYSLKIKVKSHEIKTPVKPQPDIAKIKELNILPSSTSGVSFTNSIQKNNAVAQVHFGKLFLSATEKTIAHLPSGCKDKLKTGNFSKKVKYNSFRLIFCVRPPPFS